jgi:DNA gyrase/topoisomerase IV subunit A
MEKTVTEYLDQDYGNYAKYVIEHRAIPSVIDGFKPTQRKVIHIASKVWKGSNNKPLKIFQLGGKVASDANYHHGDASLSSAIVGMAQSFKNSMPLLDEIGQFGSLRSPEAGAPRYISTKLNENFKLLYKDFELLDSRYEEGIEIEPSFFLPIIPTVLLNGGSGIAVGFATNILNRNPIDLIDSCIKELSNKKYTEPKPWYRGFTGSCERDEINSSTWILKGTYEIKNTSTVHISELPPSVTYEKYDKYLISKEESKEISTYDDNSKSNINYTLKFKRADLDKLVKTKRLNRFLKIEERQSENLTMLDENGKLKIFDNVKDIIKYFINFRLSYYDKRKDYLIKTLKEQLTVLSNKARFIKDIIDGKLIVNNAPKKSIIIYLEANNFDKTDGFYNYLLSMQIYTLTKEKYEELLSQEIELEKELDIVKSTLPIDMYKKDLGDLKKVIIKNQ